MNKTSIFITLFVVLLVATGCSNQEAVNKEGIEANIEEKARSKEEKESPATLTQEEAKSLLEETMDRLISTLDGLGEEYNWIVNFNEPDMEIIRGEINPFSTDNLFEQQKEGLYRYFAETDFFHIPRAIRPDIRLAVEQNENKLTLETIELANDMYDGSLTFFDFIYDGETWKLDDWYYGSDIELTREEAQAIVNQLGDYTYTFKEEKEEDGVNHYVFTSEDTTVSVNSATTYVSYDYQLEEETPEEEPSHANETNVEDEQETAESLVNNYERYNGLPVDGLNNSQYYCDLLWDIHMYTSHYSESADNIPKVKAQYQLCMDVMNEVLALLEKHLNTETFKKIESEQAQWVLTLEQEAKAAAEGYEQPKYEFYYYEMASDLADDRCLDLVIEYMD